MTYFILAAAIAAHPYPPHTPVDMEIVAACGDTSRHVPKRKPLVLSYLEHKK